MPRGPLYDPSEPIQPDRLYKVEDIAARLGVSRSFVYKFTDPERYGVTGPRLATVRIGTKIRISGQAFADWIKALERAKG